MKPKFYIIKTKEDYCEIMSVANKNTPKANQVWGPFNSQEEAIRNRVGLIRAGKCKPV